MHTNSPNKPNSSSFGIVSLALVVWFGLACGSGGTSSKELKRLDPPTKPTLLVQPEPKGKTGVYQQDFRIIPTLLVDGKSSRAEHAFTLFSMASYSGKKPTCVAKSLAMSISHETSDLDEWRFPPNASVSVIIDGAPTNLKVYNQLPYKMPSMADHMKNPKASEGVTIEPGCQVYQLLSKAQTISFKIGNATFDLAPDGVQNFREFGRAIGY